jgi:hypothetical protein
VPVVATEAAAKPGGWIPNAVDVQADKPTRYNPPASSRFGPEWMEGEVAIERGMDPRYLTPEDAVRLETQQLAAAPVMLAGDGAECATFLRASIALAKANVAAANDSDSARRWALVRTKAEEALLYALFGDRV